ncbi:OLC1v1014835C1 [Oldenlandia corymbosa var. corymbosa]|uniref:ribonuclease Z n=1 Tax=Oldenlandia corymbosa var. corymbosa TaxID=529605 RepID=A0AAV1E261_OLDCO|nr:OLC1v1014835C1 [Oldenlandia corymbosa var. corymbosa]
MHTQANFGTMPQISSLRLLFSSGRHHTATTTATATATNLSSSFSLFFKPKNPSLHRPIAYPIQPQLRFFAFSSYSKKYSRSKNPNSQSFNLRHRSSGTSSGTDKSSKGKSGLPMESEEGPSAGTSGSTFGFNRKRAEGRDKDSKKNLQLKVRKLNPVNTISYVQILGTGMDTQDTSPSVLLFFDKQRFIFNAGEGLQRYCTEHKIKLSKIDHIFLSRVCSETAGGLPGLLLTLAGMGDEGMSVNVWGPSDLKYLVDAMKSFIPNAAMVHTRSFGPASDSIAKDQFCEPLVLINDEVIKLSAVLSRPSPTAVMNEGSSTTLRSELTAEPTLKPGDLAVIYICELPEIQGKFDPSKAAALGLKPGPKFRELQLGNSVKSDRQNIMVHPSDVMGPSVPGPIVLLVDCPTLMHLRDMSSAQSLSAYYTDTSGDSSHTSKAVNCVIHLSPSHVTNTTDYQKWMSRFSGAQHIMAGHEMRNIEFPILQASAKTAARLNYLCPQFFPAPGFWSHQHLNIPSGLTACGEGLLSGQCETIPAENLLKFNLRPYAQLGLDRSSVPKRVSHSEIIDELMTEIPEIADASDHVSQLWLRDGKPSMEDPHGLSGQLLNEEKDEHPDCLEDISREDLEIVLLGTGSSQPSKYRNVSSILVNLFSKGSLLFDCGEGTLGQLKRRFGVEGADDVIRGLRCIWISHIHADHHTGLARILALRRELLKGLPHEPLLVVGPRQLKRFLDAYQRLEDLDMVFLDCRHTTESSLNELDIVPKTVVNGDNVMDMNEDRKIDLTLFAKGSRMQSYFKLPSSSTENAVVYPILKTLMKVLGEAGLETLMSFPVVHCPQAFGVVLKSANRVNGDGKTIPGWKIVYSGDTRPCPELVKAANGATILIHEATFEDGMLEEAVARNHSTTGEAVQVGDSAGAYRIILTHFSQRYPKIPVFDEAHSHNTCIAFDMMSVNLADLPLLPKVVPFVKLLFRDQVMLDEFDEANLESAVA